MEKLNLAFCSTWERTESWLAIGSELAWRDFGVFFVITPKEYLDLALKLGFPRERILWLRIDEALSTPISQSTIDKIAEYEIKTGIRLKHFLLMDRFLRVRPFDEQFKYAAYCFEKLHDFYDRNNIQFISGEPTTTVDFVSLLICRATGRHYAAPFDLRFPGQFMMLWDSEKEEMPLTIGAKTPDDVTEEEIEVARQLRQAVLDRKRMTFVQAKTKAPSLGFSFVLKLLRGALYRALIRSRHDGYVYRFVDVFKHHRYHMIPINHRMNRLMWNSLFDKPVDGEKFVLYTLNYTPEHSIDVEAPYFTNTIETVKNISRSLPSDVKLYVKEHPNALGIRGPRELKQIKQIPGVKLIAPTEDSHSLLNKALMTVSLSGTVSLEAAMYGKRSVILGDIFIKHFSTVQQTSYPWEVGDLLEKPAPLHDPEADIRYIAWLYSNASHGTIQDRITNPNALVRENVSALADGYEKAMNNMIAGDIKAKPLLDGSSPWESSEHRAAAFEVFDRDQLTSDERRGD